MSKFSFVPSCTALAVVAAVFGAAVSQSQAAQSDLSTQLMLCTFKITDGQTAGTTFVLDRAPDAAVPDWVLVTAGHVLEQLKQDDATLVLRKRVGDEYVKHNFRLPIRRDGKPLWTKHATQDAAAMRISLPAEVELPRIPLGLLASDESLARYEIHPGDGLHCIGFPHAGQFEPNEAGFALVRVGCLASYPLLPTEKTKTFMVDYNTFEGDSGGAVYLDDPRRTVGDGEERVQLILGLVHGQQFIDEKFQTIYQSGQTRHRMGLAIIVHASAIREVLAQLESTAN